MSVVDRFFVDTNVLLYWIDTAEPRKQEAAAAWIDALWNSGVGRVSWQVLNEFYVNAVRKFRAPADNMRRIVEAYSQWQPVSFSIGLIRRGWHWSDEAQVSYWDSLIVAAAEYTGCKYLLSEDFQAGRQFESMTVIDPFRHSPREFLISDPV